MKRKKNKRKKSISNKQLRKDQRASIIIYSIIILIMIFGLASGYMMFNEFAGYEKHE